MPPLLESWGDTKSHTKHIQETLSGFTFDKSIDRRARSPQDVTKGACPLPKWPSALAEDILRANTSLKIAMGIDPSPRTRTIITKEEIVQSIEIDVALATAAVPRRRAVPAEDLPLAEISPKAALATDLSPRPKAQEDIVQSIEIEGAAIEALEVEDEVMSTIPSIRVSRETTPDIVRSKFEAFEMFSRDGTPLRSREAPVLALGDENDKGKYLDDENTEAEIDEEVRQKLKAVGVIGFEDTTKTETSNEAPRTAWVTDGAESEDIHMENAHDEFLQSKLEAMGVISRPPTPVSSSSRIPSYSSSTYSISRDDNKQLGTVTAYDEFLQSKLEAMGVIQPIDSSAPADSTSLRDTPPPAHSSEGAEIKLTSAPSIIVKAFKPTSQGDGAPPLSWAASPTAVTGGEAKQKIDDNEFAGTFLNQSSVDMSIDETTSLTRESSYSTLEDEPTEVRKESIMEIRAAELIHPLSRYDNYERPLPISKERNVVREFGEIIGDKHNAEHAENSFIEFGMDDFMIYLPGTTQHHPYEMTGLQNIFRMGHQEYLIDGILSLDGEDKRYVEGMPFKTLSIGSYGKDHEEITCVWIQTRLNSKSDIYYRLRTPHRHYERFHTAFMWLANLSKNFVDYALDTIEAEGKVSIHNFRRDFYDWCVAEHGDEASFQKWYSEYGNPDFRTAIASNIDWLAKEAIGSYRLADLEVWAEVKYLTKVPFHEAKEYKTIVTPFVYECFKEMSFGRFLKKVDPNADTDFRRKSIGEALHLSTDQDVVELEDMDYEKTTARLAKRSLDDFKSRSFDKDSIAVGDVLAVVKDSGHISKWKSQKTKWSDVDECWFVYVQSIEGTKRGERAFRILWMYKPADTSCALMKYPFQDELFLSAHCECDQKNCITEDQAICRVSIAWGGNHGCKEDFFVRQQFHQHHMSFATLKESHKKCEHLSSEKMPAEVQKDYLIGDTVLIQPRKSRRHQRLEPCEIVSFNQDESVTVRRLLRRSEAQPESNSKANELVYTDQMLTIPAAQIHHECQVRFYSTQEVAEKVVPPPYNLNGSCDFFYICTRLIEDFLFGAGQRFEEVDTTDPPRSLIQGFDPKAPPPKNPMRGLDLFCGGGNMGRGLEDGGAVRFTHACDYQDNAIASYYASTEDTEHTKFFAGSVNDLLKHAMDGNPSNISGVPLPGDIEFISAGSPCQGFSSLNPLKKNDEALRNQSLIADVASMVEFYRPKYAVLENVIAMAKRGEGRRDDCLSQLTCCLVGMGYQLQVNLLDAWSFGCPQSRTRLFVVVAAPDLAMPRHPYLSHSHPDNINDRGLGEMANGLSFGRREFDNTAFKWVSAEAATADLPDIGDGQTYHCTPFPDHRMSRSIKELVRKQLAAIPLFPPAMNARKAWDEMSPSDRLLFRQKSTKTGELEFQTLVNQFERVEAKRLFHTITTACAPAERFNGRVAHWSQQRTITIMEAKRAQGFLDTDVLVGSRADQYKIVGNSVARPVAIAEGMALRRAWLQNEDDNPSLDAALVPITVRDDIAQLGLPSAPSSKGSELAYRRAIRALNSNFEIDEDSSVCSAPPKRRETQYSVVIPARKSVLRFESSPVPERLDEEPVEQPLDYIRRLTSPLTPLLFTPVWPGAESTVAPSITAADPAEDGDVQMCEASPVEEIWQEFDELPSIRPSKIQVRRPAKKRRRMMGGVTPGSSRVASESPAPAASMSRADTSIVQASQKLAHLGGRRSQGPSGTATPVVAESRSASPAPRPSSRHSKRPTERSFSKADASIARAGDLMSIFGRRGSKTASQQVSRAVTPHDDEEAPPRTAKRRRLPDRPIVPGSAERPIALDESEDEVAPSLSSMRTTPARVRTETPAARAQIAVERAESPAARTRTPARPENRTGGWTTLNTPPSAQSIMAQLPLVGRARASARASPSPSLAGRLKKAKKAKEPNPFVIDLTADSDDKLQRESMKPERRPIQPYVPVDNSAWMGMMFPKSRLGGLGDVDDKALLRMSTEGGVGGSAEFGAVEEVRRLESGAIRTDREIEVERDVVYAY